MTSQAVFIGGRSGAGKTTVGFEMHAVLSAAGVSHCLIDGDFLDMAYPPPAEHKLAERNLAAMWSNYRALGYHRMIYTNTVSVLPDVMEQLTTTMGDHPRVVAILLTCTDTIARDRLGQREIGSTLEEHLTSSAEMAGVLDSGAPHWAHRITTDNRSVAEVATEVIDVAGWLRATP